MSEPASRALRHAAAIGPEFSAELLRRIGNKRRRLPAALAEAVRSGLAVAVGAGRYRFSHDLVREALYEEIEPTERVALHRQIADALEQLPGGWARRKRRGACLPLFRGRRGWRRSTT